MARVLGLEEIPIELRNELGLSLRVCDEAIVLPTASRSKESGSFKNVVMRFAGNEGEINSDIFSPNWFAGVSAVAVPSHHAELLMRDAGRRKAALTKLAARIPSEMADSDVQVGPKLDGDEDDRDKEGWIAGFDSPSCCVGLYSARQSRAPEAGMTGMNRAHNAYYLVCKAGGGVAAQTFHSRLISALKAGRSLDNALEMGDAPGPQALRRVALAAQRNRVRILATAADALGFIGQIDTISDNAACSSAPHRGVIPTIDVTYNSLRRVDNNGRAMWQYSAGCVDASVSQGLMSSSNLAEGFIAFTSSEDAFRLALRNEANDCLPFVTPRLKTTRELSTEAGAAHQSALKGREKAHPDHEFVHERFIWKSKDLDTDMVIEPPPLWGSHQSEAYLASWARELGVAQYKAIRMSPEAVCIAAMEPSKLRAVVRKLKGLSTAGAVGLS